MVERVDAHPHLKARFGEWYYTLTGVGTFNRRYLVHPPRLEARFGDETVAGVTVIVQNSAPYTYFGDRPVDLAEGATLTSGDLAAVVLDRAWPTDVPTIIGRALFPPPQGQPPPDTCIRSRGCVACASARWTTVPSRSRSTGTTSERSTRPSSA